MKTYAFATMSADSAPELSSYELSDVGHEQVLVEVENCGLCHSDLSMLHNEWGMTSYPFVGGHEIIGRAIKVGPGVSHIEVGQRVGVGWCASSCRDCGQCLSGHHNRCPQQTATIVGRPGGFASHVLAQGLWAFPIPESLRAETAGPLFCGGITVFNPFVSNNIVPTDRVGVVGIGGLGHLALQFAHAWGCEVTAFSSSANKEEEARSLGAHHFVDSRDEAARKELTGRFAMILVTVNVAMDWQSFIPMLAPGGVLHFVGAAPPVELQVFPMIQGEKSFKASPLGSPATVHKMLEFCARHKIEAMTERFPMSRLADAVKHLEEGKARYRIVLEADFAQLDLNSATEITVPG